MDLLGELFRQVSLDYKAADHIRVELERSVRPNGGSSANEELVR